MTIGSGMRNQSQMTSISIRSLRCPELERDILKSIGRARRSYSPTRKSILTSKQVFQSEMMSVIRAIENRPRFDLLKRFIAHGSLLPSWEKKFQNSKRCLDDDELADCVNFVTGHMITKFQGKLAEMLAAAPIADQVSKLAGSGKLPPDRDLVFGSAIRCLPSTRSEIAEIGDAVRGIEGPDAMCIANLPGGRIEVCLVAEIKSYAVSPARLCKQSDGHLQALRRGAILRDRRIKPQDLCFPRKGPIRVFVRPSNWQMTRRFRLVTDSNGVSQVEMEKQVLPAAATQVENLNENARIITLAWSHDALRAAAFRLMHSYMGEIGRALAADPNERVRADMSPAEAGENDFRAQLHAAIFRQREAEPDARRRGKTLELYNVLGFGWALGHGFRDKDGKLSMMFHEDLQPLCVS